MGERKHLPTNASGLVALLAYAAEQWFAELFNEWWQDVPWGVIALVLGAFWLGAQVARFEIGDHWAQLWWRRWRTKAALRDDTMRMLLDGGWSAYAEAVFLSDLRNVVIKTDTFRQTGTPLGWFWKRIARTEVLSRKECNAGDTEEILLIQARPRLKAEKPPQPPVNALAALTGEAQGKSALSQYLGSVAQAAAVPTPPKTRDPNEGFFRVRVTITATGMSPVQEHYDFEWRDGELRPLPLIPKPAEYGGDTLKVDDGIKTLWMN